MLSARCTDSSVSLSAFDGGDADDTLGMWPCRNLADSSVVDRAGPAAIAAEPTANGTPAAPPQSDAIAALLDLDLDAAAPAEQVIGLNHDIYLTSRLLSRHNTRTHVDTLPLSTWAGRGGMASIIRIVPSTAVQLIVFTPRNCRLFKVCTGRCAGVELCLRFYGVRRPSYLQMRSLGFAILWPLYLHCVLGPRLRGGRGRAQAHGRSGQPQRPAGRGPPGRRRRGDAAAAGEIADLLRSMRCLFFATFCSTAVSAVLHPWGAAQGNTTMSHWVLMPVNAVCCGTQRAGHARRRRRRWQRERRVGPRGWRLL